MRVTFDFAGTREVHYLAGVPEVGDLVSHRDEVWVVLRVDGDGAGPFITCELPSAPSTESGSGGSGSWTSQSRVSRPARLSRAGDG